MPQSEPKHPQGETPSPSLDWASKRVASWLPGFIFIAKNYAIIIEYLALLVNPASFTTLPLAVVAQCVRRIGAFCDGRSAAPHNGVELFAPRASRNNV
jgi:hypothetical protein